MNRANRREDQSCEANGSTQHPEKARCRNTMSPAVSASWTAGQFAEKVVAHQPRVPLEMESLAPEWGRVNAGISIANDSSIDASTVIHRKMEILTALNGGRPRFQESHGP
jgi:hypothetical protein